MKHVCIINKTLKMSKGKIARVCLNLGFQSYTLISAFKRHAWMLQGSIGITLKTYDINEICNKLIENDISFVMHKDMGKTQVPEGSNCGVAFFISDTKYDLLFKQEKLL